MRAAAESPATPSSGSSAATTIAAVPPIEAPTSTMRSNPRSRANASAARTSRSITPGSFSPADEPWPRKSSVSTLRPSSWRSRAKSNHER